METRANVASESIGPGANSVPKWFVSRFRIPAIGVVVILRTEVNPYAGCVERSDRAVLLVSYSQGSMETVGGLVGRCVLARIAANSAIVERNARICYQRTLKHLLHLGLLTERRHGFDDGRETKKGYPTPV